MLVRLQREWQHRRQHHPRKWQQQWQQRVGMAAPEALVLPKMAAAPWKMAA
jgi:hypothetical protein